MKVFISWSKGRSRAVAEALRDWLPDVIQTVEPWVSSEDIDAGKRWNTEIAQQLAETRFGIICVTPENQEAPWILFEAGALAKTIESTNVCPYLVDLEKSDLKPGPLTQFQATKANKEETWKLIQTINKGLDEGKRLEDVRLQRSFERTWSTLDSALNKLPEVGQVIEPKRDIEEMTEEILELVREISRQQKTKTPSKATESSSLIGKSFWSLLFSRANPQLQAFLGPARIKIDESNGTDNHFTIELYYSTKHKFHFEQLKRRKEELEKIMNGAANEINFTANITIWGPNKDDLIDMFIGSIF